jgi:hypothetical protein
MNVLTESARAASPEAATVPRDREPELELDAVRILQRDER